MHRGINNLLEGIRHRLAEAYISVGAMDKSVRVWARKLEKQGFETEVDTFRTGPGGDMYGGPSTVRLSVEKSYKGPHGDATFRWYITFLPNGFGSLTSERSRIGGYGKWREMKAEAVKRLNKALEREGLPTV